MRTQLPKATGDNFQIRCTYQLFDMVLLEICHTRNKPDVAFHKKSAQFTHFVDEPYEEKLIFQKQ